MAYCFGDGFDCYAAVGDATAGFWDSGVGTGSIVAGRFSGSKALSNAAIGNSGNHLVKSSGINDAVHHFVFSVNMNTSGGTATANGFTLHVADGATNQCGIAIRGNGDMAFYAGTVPTGVGTPLALYASAVSVAGAGTWTAFEVEIVVHNTAGSIAVRKNGNTSNDFAVGSLNTRTSANNYANKVNIGYTQNSGYFWALDDILWRSDAASVPFVGDIRCYTRLPASDASVQFARAPVPGVAQTAGTTSPLSRAANLGIMSAFTATYSGTISSGVVQVTVGGTGNMKAAIYDATRAIVLATSNVVVNPIGGGNVITFGTPLTVTKGTTYYLAVDQDFTINYTATANSQWGFTTTYASFPVASPGLSPGSQGPVYTVNITPTINSELVNETPQDGTTSYVYDSTVGHADLYNIASIAATPASTVAVITRAFAEKLDAGFRQVTVQVKSGATTVQATPQALSNSFGWIYRTDTVDPATGAAWTPAAVNSLQVGPLITG